MCILASTSREEVFQTICSLAMFFERQMVMELFSKSRHCNYWASHSGLLLDGSMWFHVQRWSKLSQTYSVTNTQFSQPMSGIVKDFSCSSWSWWWKGQPSHCQLLQPPLGGGVATFIVFSQRRLFVQGIIRFFSSNPRRLRQSAALRRASITGVLLLLLQKLKTFLLKCWSLVQMQRHLTRDGCSISWIGVTDGVTVHLMERPNSSEPFNVSNCPREKHKCYSNPPG